jgi:predicted TPR repeat methyltransferase
LYQHGFRLIDGLDPSKGMLDVAEKKKKYRTLYYIEPNGQKKKGKKTNTIHKTLLVYMTRF